ncbi:major facilitator superfamily protein, partial [Plectosphaerella plurivora]
MTTDEKVFSEGVMADVDKEGLRQQHEETITDAQREIEKAIRHKFDRRVLPLGIIIFLVAHIDRSNMSNALVLGLREDADLSGDRFNVALSMFFVTYILFELPANFMCKKLGPRLWLSFITAGFGLVTMSTAFVTSYGGVMTCRLLLGALEAGVQPGLMYTYSQFYRRHEMASRWGIKAAGGSIAGAFGGLLGSRLGNIPQAGMLVRWRWIFLIEGIITVFVGLDTWLFMPASAEQASFLTEEERKVAAQRIHEENKTGHEEDDLSPWRFSVLKKALWNANTQLVSLGIMMSLLSLTALSLFMPSLIKSMGYSSTNAQLLTVPPYILAAIICVAASFASDRLKTRGLVILCLTPLTMIGFLLLALVPSTAERYFAPLLTTLAAFTCSPILLAWVVSNSAGSNVRAIVAAYAVGEGNIGSIIATWTYRPNAAPRYMSGHLINFGGACILLVVSGVTTVYLRRENKKRALGERDYRHTDGKEPDWALGHSHPAYRYT